MKILKLKLQNFLSHVDSEINLDGLGVVLIEGENRDRGGSNGAGKTAIVDALYWCLYGQLLRDIKVSKIPFRGTSTATVTATLLDDENRTVVIKRQYVICKSGLLELTVNGVAVSAGTIAETQKQIDKLLRMDARTFNQIVLFSARSNAFAALTDKGQKEILDAILGLDRLPKALERVTGLIRDHKQARSAIDYRFTDLTMQVAQVEKDIARLTKDYELAEKSKLIQIRDAKAAVIRLATSAPVEDTKALAQLATDQARLEQLDKLLGPVAEEATKAARKLSEAKQEKTKLEVTIQHVRRELASINVPDPDALVVERSNCPTCEQTLPLSALNALHAKYSEVRNTALEAKKLAQERLDAALAAHKVVLGQITDYQLAHDNKQAGSEERNLLKLRVSQAQADARIYAVERVSWERQLADAKAKVEAAEKLTNPYSAQLELSLDLRNDLAQALVKAQEEQAKLDEELHYLEFWKVGFGNQGVKGLLLDNVTPVLNDRANHYLEIATSGTAKVEFMTHFRDGDDNIKEKFDVQAGFSLGADSYGGSSDGERRRIDLSCLFALGDLAAARAGARFNLRLLDEPFGPLDAVGHEQVLKLLQLLARDVGTVLVTSHEDTVRALIDKRILVSKAKGISRVEQ